MSMCRSGPLEYRNVTRKQSPKPTLYMRTRIEVGMGVIGSPLLSGDVSRQVEKPEAIGVARALRRAKLAGSALLALLDKVGEAIALAFPVEDRLALVKLRPPELIEDQCTAA